jgi:hypothetical protein
MAAGWVARWRKKDPRRLYTTGAGWPVLPGSDFHIPPEPAHPAHGARDCHRSSTAAAVHRPSTGARFVKHPDAPVISHEIGQWCVYPNFAEIEKYDGYFKARNFEIFRETARRNGMLDQAAIS